MGESRAAPVVLPADHGSWITVAPGTRTRELLGDDHGCRGLRQRQVRIDASHATAGIAGDLGECWFILRGAGRVRVPAGDHPVSECTAVWLPSGTPFEVSADGEMEILATTMRRGTPPSDDDRVQIVHLADCAVEYTGDREFRVLLSEGLSVTQFAGYIPPGRAPAHHHTYDEVVHVLAGRGVVHLAAGDSEIGPGTSIYLPPLNEHCLENTGAEPLRVLGVFHPAGSPAAKKETH